MSKKPIKVKDIELEVKTEKVKAKVVKKDKKLDVLIDTPKVDVTIHKDEEMQEIIFDGEKLDVEVVKTEQGTTVKIKAANPVLEKLGNALGRLFKKRLNKK